MNEYYKKIEEWADEIKATVEDTEEDNVLKYNFEVSNAAKCKTYTVSGVVNFNTEAMKNNFKDSFSVDLFKSDLNTGNIFITRDCVITMKEVIQKIKELESNKGDAGSTAPKLTKPTKLTTKKNNRRNK